MEILWGSAFNYGMRLNSLHILLLLLLITFAQIVLTYADDGTGPDALLPTAQKPDSPPQTGRDVQGNLIGRDVQGNPGDKNAEGTRPKDAQGNPPHDIYGNKIGTDNR